MVTHPKKAKSELRSHSKKRKKKEKKRRRASSTPPPLLPASFEREARKKQVRYREVSNSLSPPPTTDSPPKSPIRSPRNSHSPPKQHHEHHDKKKAASSNSRKPNDSRYMTLRQLHERLPGVMNRLEKMNSSLENLQDFVDHHGYVYGNAHDRSTAQKLYGEAKKNGDIHAEYLRKMLVDIDYMRKHDLGELMACCDNRQDLMYILKQQAHALPLYVGGVNGDPGPGVGALPIPDTVPLKAGDFVAALFEETWILGEVGRLLGNGRYEILDVDQEHRDSESRPKVTAYVLRKLIVPLPKYRADPRREPHALFPNDSVVLALYPQTTCFYKGVVCKSPTSVWEDYEVMFEDNGYPTGFSPPLQVPQRYVVTYKDVVDTEYIKKVKRQECRAKQRPSDRVRETVPVEDRAEQSEASEDSFDGVQLPVLTIHAKDMIQVS